MSDPEWPPAGGQALPPERAAEPAGRVPAEAPAEITAPLPPVPARPQQPDQETAGLPLLDLLAPEQGGAPERPPGGYSLLAGHNLLAGYDSTPGYGPTGGGYGGYGEYGEQPGPAQAGQGAYPAPGYGPPATFQPAPPPAGRRRRLDLRIVAAVGAGVLVIAVLGVWALSSPDTPSLPSQQARPSTAAPTSTAVRTAGGYQFTQHAARTDTDCAANAYGKVAEFFGGTPCARLDRALYTTTVDGRLVVASVSVVLMGTEQAATELKRLADTNGTGNVSDLLRAGVRVPNGPESLTDAGYAAAREGSTVIIAEADFAEAAVRDGDLLDRISQVALQLRT